MKPAIVYLFTNDLRLQDNEALTAAVNQAKRSDCPLYLLYCLEQWQFPTIKNDQPQMGQARYRFLYQSLHDLKLQLAAHQQQLSLYIGSLRQALNEINKQHEINRIYTSQSAGWYEQQRLKALETDYEIHCFYTLSLYKPCQFEFNIDELPKHFTPFRKKVEHLDIDMPLPVPQHWPQNAVLNIVNWTKLPEPKIDFETPHIGGCTAGDKHLDEYFSSSLPKNYKNVRNALLGWDNSTKFSAWLALGCVSPRQIMAHLKVYEAKHGANESTYWIFFELLWREFFYFLSMKAGRKLYLSTSEHQSQNNNQRFKQWCEAKTSEPLINACMRQLNQTGYMSNRGRQIAASYLINELQLDWRLGARYFEQHLIDYDVAANWGNWQYIAGVGADPRGGRHFNLKKQQQTHDPNGRFIKQWQTHYKAPDRVDWSEITHQA